MKKKISIVIIFVFLVFCIFAVGVVIGVFKTPSFLMGNNQELTDMDKIKKVIEETRPTDIAIMGEDIPFEVDINYKKINKLSDETLNSDKDYLVVIINDINNSISLSKMK